MPSAKTRANSLDAHTLLLQGAIKIVISLCSYSQNGDL